MARHLQKEQTASIKSGDMKYFSRKELKVKKRQTFYGVVGIIVIVCIYLFLTQEKKTEPEAPVVTISTIQQENVNIYGEYVGRIRAQQFVEIRARV